MLAGGLLLAVVVTYFVHGSLEEFPSEARTSQIRLITGVVAALLIGVEVGLWILLRHLSQDRIRPDAATSGAGSMAPQDRWGSAVVQDAIWRELERIGASPRLRGGFAADGPITPAQLLAAFAATPDGAGDAAFLAALRAQTSPTAGDAGGPSAAGAQDA